MGDRSPAGRRAGPPRRRPHRIHREHHPALVRGRGLRGALRSGLRRGRLRRIACSRSCARPGRCDRVARRPSDRRRHCRAVDGRGASLQAATAPPAARFQVRCRDSPMGAVLGRCGCWQTRPEPVGVPAARRASSRRGARGAPGGARGASGGRPSAVKSRPGHGRLPAPAFPRRSDESVERRAADRRPPRFRLPSGRMHYEHTK